MPETNSNEGGNLVFEGICKFQVTQADAKAACKGFKRGVTIPPVGSHVALTGTDVQDTKSRALDGSSPAYQHRGSVADLSFHDHRSWNPELARFRK
jgi:hypothetical protein